MGVSINCSDKVFANIVNQLFALGNEMVIKQWKQENDYHQRSLSETAMYRYKQLISQKLSLRDYNGQVGEALAGVKVMNKVIGLGMPIRQRVN